MAGEGVYTDFKIYSPEFQAGFTLSLLENLNAFNEASRGAIQLSTRNIVGHFETLAGYKEISDLITHRDISSVDDATYLKLEQDEDIRVKVNKKIGPVAQTLDSLKKISRDAGEMSLQVGKQAGKAYTKVVLASCISALTGTVKGIAALGKDCTGQSDPLRKSIDHRNLIRILRNFGDQTENVVCWLMNSGAYHDLMENAVADALFDVANVVIKQGTTHSLNRPVIVTDAVTLSSGGTSSNDPTLYTIYGLTAGAVVAEESEDRTIVSKIETGKENLLAVYQGELAYNLGVRGFSYVKATGVNPNDTTLASTGSWTQIGANNYDSPGVWGTVQEAA